MNNRYMAATMIQRYHFHRKDVLEKLGGKCVKCGSTKDLHIDHIDPNDKSFNVSERWSIAPEKFEEELKKCQLLCKNCHIEKTVIERGQKMARGTHGTLSSYRYCKCDECKKAKREYMQKRRLAKQ